MGCGINTPSPTLPILCKFSGREATCRIKIVSFSSSSPNQESISTTTLPKHDACAANFKTLGACKLGISRYPDFEYNAQGGTGTGIVTNTHQEDLSNDMSISFDLETLYIPPLTSATTKFLGFPLPPPLRINISPELFLGTVERESGKVQKCYCVAFHTLHEQVELEFTAKFTFSVGRIYRAPPLLVKTVLTTEESNGKIRSGRGERLDKEGNCRLVGVAFVDPIDDVFMNTFLGLPTECIAELNAIISFSDPC